MQEAPRNANLGSMWQTVVWSTSKYNDRLSTTPWAIHSPPQIWKVQDWLSESLRGAVLGHKNEETESYVGMFWTKICPVGSESKTRLQLESVQVVEAVARSWHESSLCRDLFSNFTSGSRPELSKVAKPWTEWSHSECQAKCSGLYKGHPTCFHWAAFAAHVDPVKIGRPTTQLPAKWPHHPHLTPVQAQCTMTCRKMSGFILCRIPWSFSPHRWRQAPVTITTFIRSTQLQVPSQTKCAPLDVSPAMSCEEMAQLNTNGKDLNSLVTTGAELPCWAVLSIYSSPPCINTTRILTVNVIPMVGCPSKSKET